MSIDGFIAGLNGELDWAGIEWSDDIKQYVDGITNPVDTILLGKNLATGFIPYWASVAADSSNPERQAGIFFTQTPKVVFSKTLTTSAWENTEIENLDFVKKINTLKKQPGKDMIAYGGSKFVSSLIRENLVDEFHLFINPVILGKGMPIFQEIGSTRNVSLVSTRQFECGITVLLYKPI